MKKMGLCLGFLSAYLLGAPLLADSNMYRYTDKDGHLAITNTLPPEIATQGGYAVINSRGSVIENIPRVKTKEEQAQDAVTAEKERADALKIEAEKKKAALQAKKDEIILQSYSKVEDITRSRDEKIASVHILVEITHDNIERLQKQLTDANLSKKAYQNSNQKTPENLQKTIDDTERQIKESEAFLARKTVEINEIQNSSQTLIDRFNLLKQQEKDIKSEP